ncbi:MAG: TIGR03790 family protein [Burkholderiales bacterium PBB6]|nr:MAG: TIGR03790 family protein [Burkholderiales bacterium PBB6]
MSPASSPGQAAPAVAVPRLLGRLQAAQIGLVINDDDAYSVAVGEHYQRQRGLAPAQVLHVRLPVRARLELAQAETLRSRIAGHFGPNIQALALAWRQPFAVQCNSITSVVTLGFRPAQCESTCGKGEPSPLFNQATVTPFTDLGVRPSMLLAAPDEAAARAMIDRGVAADGTLGRRFAPAVSAWYLQTTDAARNVRNALYPRPGPVGQTGLTVHTGPEAALARQPGDPAVLLQIGAARWQPPVPLRWAPGALADHLTSFGGVLDGTSGQFTATDWIAAGATASHGTVSEPCNHLQKFPHPQVVLLHYLQGATAIEAYWKSVLWPAQSLFVGEPLAAPFGPPSLAARPAGQTPIIAPL